MGWKPTRLQHFNSNYIYLIQECLKRIKQNQATEAEYTSGDIIVHVTYNKPYACYYITVSSVLEEGTISKEEMEKLND